MKGIPNGGIAAVDRAVGKRVLVKWGTRSGAVRLGSVVPFGLGVGLGGGSNFLMARALGRVAIGEFSDGAGYAVPAAATPDEPLADEGASGGLP